MAPQLTRRPISKLTVLIVALALSSLVAAVMTLRPAHANSTPFISAYGGPGEIWVSGNGFTPGATVRVEAVTNPGLKVVGSPQNTQADSYGDIGMDLYNLKSAGSVYVLADQLPPAPYLGTAGAKTVVNPMPQFLAAGQTSCGYPVTASTYGFQPYYNVRFELLSQDLTKLLDKRYVTSDWIGDAYASPPLAASGYTGWAWIIVDEYGSGPTGYIPAPATIGYHLYVC